MNISSIFVLVLCIGCIHARGARGGGGYRGGSSYRGSRYSSTGTRSSYRSAFSGHRISSSSSVRTALLAGTVYGATRWRIRRPSYYHDDGALPTICYNDKFNQSESGNVSYYGRFVCPEDHQGFDHKYCCGEEGIQYCCTFWDDGGRVAGVVIGILLGVVAVGVFIFCLVKFMKARSKQAHRSRPIPNDQVTWNTAQTNANAKKQPLPSDGYNYSNNQYGFTSDVTAQPPPYTANGTTPYPQYGFSDPSYPSGQSNGNNPPPYYNK